MPSLLTAPPAAEPVSLAEARAHLRLTHTEEDEAISMLIASARRVVEARTGLRLIAQSWTQYRDDWPADGIATLPLAPLLSIDSLAVLGADDETASEIDPAHYLADRASRPPRLVLRGDRLWQRPGRRVNGIAIAATYGFGSAPGDVPEPLRQASLMLMAHWYAHRGAAGAPPPPPVSMDALLQPWREARL